MEKQLVPTQDEERRVRLESCEARIREAFRIGLQAKYDLARELITIETEELYDVRGHSAFRTYVTEDLHLDMNAARSAMGAYRTKLALEGAGLSLPLNESQIEILAELKEERVPIVWDRLVRVCNKADKPVTVARIRRAVELDEQELEEEEDKDAKEAKGGSKARGGVKVGLSLDDEKFVLKLTEDGERALARIRRICGEEIADAIEAGTLQLPEKAILKWAEQSDLIMRNIVHYVVDLGWRVTDAVAYDSKLPSGSTTIDTLIVLATARGGRVAVQHNEWRILIERLAEAT